MSTQYYIGFCWFLCFLHKYPLGSGKLTHRKSHFVFCIFKNRVCTAQGPAPEMARVAVAFH